MIPALALLLLTVATPSLGAQSHHPGPVVLLGAQADPSRVPELASPIEPSVLLVAGHASSPVPIDVRAWGGSASTRIVSLPPAREAETDRDLLASLRVARHVALGAGAPKTWLDALLDRERATPTFSALHEAWSAGATLVGRGESAALLSAAFSVASVDELDWDVRAPHDPGGPRAAQGLGYQPWALVDTESRSLGSLKRIVLSVCRERIELALWLPARAAVVADLTAARLRVHGEGVVILVDSSRARRNRDTLQGARLSLLPAGSVWDVGERRVALPADAVVEHAGDEVSRCEDALDATRLGAMFSSPSEPPRARRWVIEDARRRLVLRWDVASRQGRIGATGPRWIEGLACDLPLAEH